MVSVGNLLIIENIFPTTKKLLFIYWVGFQITEKMFVGMKTDELSVIIHDRDTTVYFQGWMYLPF